MAPSKRTAAKALAPKKARKRSAKPVGRIETAFSILDDDPSVAFRRVLDEDTGTMVAELCSLTDARASINAAHPPTVTPILRDKNHVIRCDWDVAKNGWRCRKIRADDPDATI